MLDVLPSLATESTSDVAADHPHLALGYPEDGAAQHVSHPVRILTVGVKRVALITFVIDAKALRAFPYTARGPE